MSLQKRRYLFRGRVQGVGFRYTTQRLAGNYDVEGYVRNLPDGAVELVAEGHPAEIDRFLTAIQETFSGQIRSLDRSDEPSGPEALTGFSIRY